MHAHETTQRGEGTSQRALTGRPRSFQMPENGDNGRFVHGQPPRDQVAKRFNARCRVTRKVRGRFRRSETAGVG
jgi:hypothetical protein